ncbi:MAG: prephenate dehydratase [Candidatus Omnitrophica bacterium]|nr:prephenate dehydratase [Candidatus Omnitrophota bacterium]
MLTIAYLGPEHTNTHLAARTRFGRGSRYVHAPTVEDVFRLVEREEADRGVVPIENSLEGAVTHTLDRFIDFKHSPVQIQGEIEQPIQHYLITYPRVKISEIRMVFSHPQALAQCRRWLQRHLPRVALRETNSTAEAVELLTELPSPGAPKPRARAAIGRKEVGRGMQTISIPNERENKTRFLVIGLGEPPKGRRHKTSILVSLKDRPGALHDMLMPFKRERINLTKIESRPSKQKAWEYLFFMDFEGHESEPRVRRALRALKRSTSLLRVLGSYPSATR